MTLPSAVVERMTDDHRRLAALLSAASLPGGRVDPRGFDEFRTALLTHIAIEEKLLMPPIAATRQADKLLRSLNADHCALAALTIPSPRHELVELIRQLMSAHDRLEEGPDGLYALAMRALDGNVETTYERLSRFPPALPSPHRDGGAIDRLIRRSLEHAWHAHAELRSAR